MKYMQTGGFERNPLMRLTLLWSLVFVSGLWVTNAFMFTSRLGLRPASVAAHYLGSEEEFAAPRSAASMLETTHAHLPVMALVILLVTHLAIFAPGPDAWKKAFISGAFLSALLGEAAGWLVRFVHPGFAYLKIACFLAFQALLAALIWRLAAFLLAQRAPRRA